MSLALWIAAVDMTFAQQGDTITSRLTNSNQVNNEKLRGFDPSPIGSAADPFPDTSRPCCLNGSSEFGNGVPMGNTRAEINQNCNRPDSSDPTVFPGFTSPSCSAQTTGAVFQNNVLFQTSVNGLLSRRSTATPACDDLGAVADDRRCNEMTFGFLQDIQEQGQQMDLNFALRSLTDADGNLIGSAQGTFTQSITENGETKACTGSFTFDETNGFVMTSGPLHGCP